MKVCWEQQKEHLEWAEAFLGVSFAGEPVRFLSTVDSDNNLLGVVIYSRFTEAGCEITVAAKSKSFLTPATIRDLFAYPFLQLEKTRLTAIIRQDNHHSYKVARKLGFTVEACLQGWFRDSDAWMLRLLRKDCKWIRPRLLLPRTPQKLPMPKGKQTSTPLG